MELPSGVQTILDHADIDIGTMLDGHVQTISPAIEASVASAASRGVFLVDEHLKRTGESFKLCGENGSMQTIEYVTDDQAVIRDNDGNTVGSMRVIFNCITPHHILRNHTCLGHIHIRSIWSESQVYPWKNARKLSHSSYHTTTFTV